MRPRTITSTINRATSNPQTDAPTAIPTMAPVLNEPVDSHEIVTRTDVAVELCDALHSESYELACQEKMSKSTW